MADRHHGHRTPSVRARLHAPGARSPRPGPSTPTTSIAAAHPSRTGCSPPPTLGRATTCSSWPAVPAALGMAAAPLVAPAAGSCCPTWRPGWSRRRRSGSPSVGLDGVSHPGARPRGTSTSRMPPSTSCSAATGCSSPSSRAVRSERSPACCGPAGGSAWPWGRPRAQPVARPRARRRQRAARPADAATGRAGAVLPQRPDRVAPLLRDAGLDQVVIEELPVPLTAAVGRRVVGGDHLARRSAGRHHRLPAGSGLRELQARAREKVAPYVTEHGLELPGLALLASGRKPYRAS